MDEKPKKGTLVTCSFAMDRQLYNEYKSFVVKAGESVKGNLVSYMQAVVDAQSTDIIAAPSNSERRLSI